ncbi:radical SAM/SPASM domain-containing protein [Paenibacillus durus]|uniref:Radical SAM core domain-containing protein n=1 Tax=Paenibacillus durus ATCC 35681 TaxID=1333534 RepID=A0A0F7CGC1_PAEDU|nr:radical SAM protein [Paenibacillus durus]AKG33381.1 hypothetical protein VK70_01115 [Paenibacillus durus ATCC 35681]
MITSNVLKFNTNFRLLKNNNEVILGNVINGLWIKCPDYVYDFLNDCISKQYNANEILEKCQDHETQEYMMNLLRKLQEIEITDYSTESLKSSSEIKSVSIEITTGCNLRCTHCCVGCGDILREDMDIADIKNIINWCEIHNVSSLVFTGGEIFLRKDIWDILSYARSNYTGIIEIMTNGTLLKQDKVPVLKSLVDYVSISLDGYNEHSVTLVRGPGVFEKVMTTIKNLQKEGITNISLSMVLTKHNISHANEFKELCLSLDVKSAIRAFSPEGRGEENYEMLSPPIKINAMDILTANEKDQLQNTANFKCVCDLDSKILISCDGEVYPCFLTKRGNKSLGNITDLLEGKLEKLYLLPIVDAMQPCASCNVRYFCASPCPGHDRSIFSVEDYRNEVCTQMKPYYTKVVW